VALSSSQEDDPVSASLDDITSLAVFARVVEARSFTGAARAMGLSKSAVSARVARLEERLAVRLLRRTTRRLSVTEAGLVVYDKASQLVTAADEAATTAERAGGEPRGLLRITAPAAFSELYLAPLVAELLAAHRALTVELDASERMVDLVGEGFDVAVRLSRLRDSTLVARKVAPDRLVVVAAPSYLARAGTPETPADLPRHNCLRSAHIPASGEWGFRSVGSGRAGGGNLVVNDASVLREAACAALGLALLPSSLVARELASGRLVTVLPGFPRRELGVYAVHPHVRQVPPKVRAFVDLLAQRFARPPWIVHPRER
jgi:DNA-binding transcriptional LysR family regulator